MEIAGIDEFAGGKLRSHHCVGRRRAALMSSIVGGVALLFAVTGCGASSESPSVPAPAAGPQTGGAAAGTSIELTSPDQIGPLIKAADQTKAESALANMKKQGYKQAIAKFYVDSADKTHEVMVAGMEMDSGNASDKVDLDKVIRSRVAPDSTVQPTALDKLKVGGVAKCIDSSTSKGKTYDCVWMSGSTLVLVNFGRFEPAKAQSLMPEILSATVKS